MDFMPNYIIVSLKKHLKKEIESTGKSERGVILVDRAEYIRESVHFINRFMMKSMQQHAEEHGVTVPQIRVIKEVYIRKAISVKELSQNLRMTQSTVSDIVERLTDKGLLIKTPNPQDKRSVTITLTDRMLKIIKESSPEPLNKVIRDTLSLLEPEEQEIVEQGMKLLVSAVGKKIEADGMGNIEEFFHPKEKCE